MKGDKERQGDFVFTANDVGEYRFCFNNEMSTWAEKLVDFEVAVSELALRLGDDGTWKWASLFAMPSLHAIVHGDE
jgi:hypothetical protein